MSSPHPHFAPPPPPPAMVTAPRSGMPKWIPWVAGGCGCLVVAGIILGVVIFAGVKAMTADAEKVVDSFLAAAGRGDAPAAYASFSGPLQQVQGYDEFAAGVSNSPHLFQTQSVSYSSRNVEGGETRLEGTATLTNGATVPVSFTLVKEGEAWKLLAYQIGE